MGKIGLGAILGMLLPNLLGRGKGQGLESLYSPEQLASRETNPDYIGKVGKVFVDRNTGQFFDNPEDANRAAQGGIVQLLYGGLLRGPGTGISDSIPGAIYQGGIPVQQAALADGEFIFTNKAVRGAGGGSVEKGAKTMYEIMDKFERMT